MLLPLINLALLPFASVCRQKAGQGWGVGLAASGPLGLGLEPRPDGLPRSFLTACTLCTQDTLVCPIFFSYLPGTAADVKGASLDSGRGAAAVQLWDPLSC